MPKPSYEATPTDRLETMRLLAVVCALLCCLTLAAAPANAAPADDPSFLVRPAPDSSTTAEGSYFLLEIEPGAEIVQNLELRNDSPEPIVLELAGVDAVTGPLGGASYGLATDEVTRAGAWIELQETSVPLEPGASASIPFTVSVPSDAQTGEHLAGLAVAAVESDAPAATTDAGGGASVDIRTRRLVAVQVNLPGAAEPELVISGVRPVARPQGLYLEIDIEHVGTALARGEGTISLPGDGFEQDFVVDTFVPRTTIAYPISWTADTREGSYDAEVELRYDGKVATWQGEVSVGEEVLDTLADRQVDPAQQQGSWTDLWPWAAIGVLLLLSAILATLYLRQRRTATRLRPDPDEA